MTPDLTDRIFEDLPRLRRRFDAGTLDEEDVRMLLQKAYALGVQDTLKNHLDYWSRPQRMREIGDER